MKRTENPHEEIFMVRHTSWEDRDLDWIQDVPNQRFLDWNEGYNTCLADVVRELRERAMHWHIEYKDKAEIGDAIKELADELSQNIGESVEVSSNSNKEEKDEQAR